MASGPPTAAPRAMMPMCSMLRVGQHPLVVALGRASARRPRPATAARRRRSSPRMQPGPTTASRDRLDPQDRVERHRQQDPGHQPATPGPGAWLCASGSQLCIGARPALVAKPRTASAHGERARASGSSGVAAWRAAHPGQGRRSPRRTARRVEQDDAEEGDRDARPSRGPRTSRRPRARRGRRGADQERGGDRGGLDGDPQDARGCRRARPGSSRPGTGTPARRSGRPAAACVAVVGSPPHSAVTATAPTTDQHARPTERVSAQQAARRPVAAPARDGASSADAGAEHRDRRGEAGSRGVQPARGASARPTSASSSGTSRGIQSRAAISRAAPSGRRGRVPPCVAASGRRGRRRISTTSSTSRDTPSSTTSGSPAGGQERDRRDAVVQHQEADQLGDRAPRRVSSARKPEQHQRRRPTGTACAAGAGRRRRRVGRLTT